MITAKQNISFISINIFKRKIKKNNLGKLNEKIKKKTFKEK